MFLSGMKESTQEVIQLRNISHTILSELIDYCYMEDILLTDSNVQSLLIAASFLDIVTIVDACCKFMENRIDVQNCLMVYCFADSAGQKNAALARQAKALILQCFVSVSQQPEFLEVPDEKVIDIIRSDDLQVPCEDQVLLAVIRWLQHDPVQRRCKFWEILQCVRPTYLSPRCSNDYLLACINAFKDCAGGEALLRQSDYLQVLPGCDAGVLSSRSVARKSYGIENIIICAGGHRDTSWTSLMDSVEGFNPITSKWRQLAQLPYSVAKTGLVVINNELFLCGGIIGFDDSRVTPRAIRYDLAGHIYAVGGHGTDTHTLATVERYDVTTNQWTYVASLPTPLVKFAIVGYDGQLFVFGGCTSNVLTATDFAFCYDPNADVWFELPRMPTARFRASACVGCDGWIYVMGGKSGSALSCVEAYNTTTKQWIKKCDICRPLRCASAFCVENKIYVLGGLNQASVATNTIYVYDVFSDTWTTSECQLPVGKWAFGCAVVGIVKDNSEHLY
ncbi:kelch-like protein 17 [Paramacrobiotus metropolitanus]|uniref:kelch-like protein 17 n=1 Tax=Paramacrobiotus metropolitanus TaxID=2943436 RepID=UPI002445AD81|nr:kelch-like protein 17 [Paramacrobiotus metropolitanus]